jgi:alpha-beta hydrolase superfamily lysophospholipase
MSAPLFFGMVEGGQLVAARAADVRAPLLMLLGTDDPVIDARFSGAVFDTLGSRDKTLRLYPGMLHEPLNELGREQVFDDIAEWLTSRLPSR